MSEFATIPLDQLVESPHNPRKHFDEAALAELAESIKAKGVLQPVLVRRILNAKNKKAAGKTYELVAGARRFRAAKLAELPSIPAIVRKLSDTEVLEIQVIENLQREDIHPLEEAAGYQKLVDSHGYDVGQLAEKLHKSQAYVYGRLRLARLVRPAAKLYSEGHVNLTFALLLAKLEPEIQKDAIEHMGRFRDPNVRELRDWIQRYVVLKVSAFPFKLSDAELLPQAGACTACPKNTKNAPLLFPDMEGAQHGLCTDRNCFRAKLSAFEAKRIQEIRNETGADKVELISTRRWYSERKDATSTANIEIVKEGAPGAKPALIVDSDGGNDLYKMVWIGPKEQYSNQTLSKPSPEQQAKRREELRLLKAENLARQRIYEACLALIEQGAGCFGGALVTGPVAKALIVKALDRCRDVPDSAAKHRGPAKYKLIEQHFGDVHRCYRSEWPTPKDVDKLPDAGSAELMRLALDVAAMDEIGICDYHRPSGYALQAFADALGIDTELIRKEADWDTLSRKAQAERLKAAEPKNARPKEPQAAKSLKGQRQRKRGARK